MQRTTSSLALSLRALTSIAVVGLIASASLADDGPRSSGYSRSGVQVNVYQACGLCARRDYHIHDANGGSLWIGGDRFDMSDRPGAIGDLVRDLRNAGYRVKRHGNELRIKDHHRIGQVEFRNGKFRSVVLDRSRKSVTIRLYQVYRDDIYEGEYDTTRPGYTWQYRESHRIQTRPSVSWRADRRGWRSRASVAVCW